MWRAWECGYFELSEAQGLPPELGQVEITKQLGHILVSDTIHKDYVMSRRTGICPAGVPHHVIQRGYNRQICFHDVSDRAAFYMYLARYSEQFDLDVHAWVLMNNHVHLLVTPNARGALAPFMKALSQGYAQYFNAKHHRVALLWESRVRSCPVDTEHYFLQCQRYIELNPVMARVVSHPDSFQWSSYGNHARGMKTKFHTPHECYLEMHSSPSPRQLRYQEFVARKAPQNMAEKIRHAVMSGKALGDAEFRKRMRELVE